MYFRQMHAASTWKQGEHELFTVSVQSTSSIEMYTHNVNVLGKLQNLDCPNLGITTVSPMVGPMTFDGQRVQCG